MTDINLIGINARTPYQQQCITVLGGIDGLVCALILTFAASSLREYNVSSYFPCNTYIQTPAGVQAARASVRPSSRHIVRCRTTGCYCSQTPTILFCLLTRCCRWETTLSITFVCVVVWFISLLDTLKQKVCNKTKIYYKSKQ